jgi:hypothetical protein
MGGYWRSRVDACEQPISPIVFVFIVSSVFRLMIITLMCAPPSPLERHYALPPFFSSYCISLYLCLVHHSRSIGLSTLTTPLPCSLQAMWSNPLSTKVPRLLPGPASPRLCATHLLVCVPISSYFIVLLLCQFYFTTLGLVLLNDWFCDLHLNVCTPHAFGLLLVSTPPVFRIVSPICDIEACRSFFFHLLDSGLLDSLHYI